MKIFYLIAGIILLIFLTLNFWLTPDYILEKINENQSVIYLESDKSSGSFLTSYFFKNLRIQKGGKTILTLNNAKVDLSLLKIFIGSLSINIYSEKISGNLNINFSRKIIGEIVFKDILFDTDYLKIPANIAFSGILEGRIKLTKSLINVEFNLNDISWREFEIEGNKLPYDIFSRAKGGIEIISDKINIKSFGFEGDRGYARLVGDISKDKNNLFIEIFPKDFSDPYMIPFFDYKQSAGYYKIPIALKK